MAANNRVSRLGTNSSTNSVSTIARTGQPSSRLVYHKVCLTGISGVGKTSLFLTIKNGEFPDGRRLSTLGVDTHDIARNIDGQFVGLGLNDTLGMERCGTLTSNYFKGAACILFLFSVEDQYSLESLDDIVKETMSYVSPKSCLYYLVASKVDLIADVSAERVEEKRIELNCAKAFFISSKTGEGVDELVDDVAMTLKMKAVNTLPTPIKLHTEDNQDTKKCPCAK